MAELATRPTKVQSFWNKLCFYDYRQDFLFLMKATKRFFLGLIAAALVQTHAPAIEFAIVNHSFEDVVVPDGYYTVNTIPGWLGEGSWHHIANPVDWVFANTTDLLGGVNPLSPIDGFNAAAVNNYGHILYQALTETVQPGWTYTLTVLVGHRLGVPLDDVSVNLIAADRFLARAFPVVTEGEFERLTLEYTAPASGLMIGETLVIELRSAGLIAQGWFDDVHLYGELREGATPSLDTPYVPIPPNEPTYTPGAWEGFKSFGSDGPLSPGWSPVPGVPDGGNTLLLLGLAVVGLALACRWLRSDRDTDRRP